jgi:hypothetical protein
MSIQAKVAIDKREHPERFCPAPKCLWKTSRLNRETQVHEGGGYCPRHESYRLARAKADAEVEQLKNGGKS